MFSWSFCQPISYDSSSSRHITITNTSLKPPCSNLSKASPSFSNSRFSLLHPPNNLFLGCQPNRPPPAKGTLLRLNFP